MNPDPGKLATKSAQGTLRHTRYFPFASQQSAPDLLQPDPTRKHRILVLLFHLPLAQPVLALCQINTPIPWKPDKIPFSAVDLSSCPQLPGKLTEPVAATTPSPP